MNISIRHIKVGELEAFITSPEYQKHSFYPISRLRAISHANNPRAEPSDTALLLAYEGEKLVGYLGTLVDEVYVENEVYKTCWFSCMWIMPAYRRAGIAKLLQKEAGLLYQDIICITNYIPVSKASFLRDDQFAEVAVLEGVRAYLKFDLAQILVRKKAAFTILFTPLRITDYLANMFLDSWYRIRFSIQKTDYSINEIAYVPGELDDFIASQMPGSIFRRTSKEFNWLLKFPWVQSIKSPDIDYDKYYFSQYAPDFKQWLFQVRDSRSKTLGLILLTRHKHELKTPYILCKEEVMPGVFDFIYQLMLKEKIRTLVTHHAGLLREVRQNRKKFLLLKDSEYGFMLTPKLLDMLKNRMGSLFEGDGDGMFT